MLPTRFDTRIVLHVGSYLAFSSPKMEEFIKAAIEEKVRHMNVESPFRDVRPISARAYKAEAL